MVASTENALVYEPLACTAKTVRDGGAYESETPWHGPRAMGRVSLWGCRRAVLGASGARWAGPHVESPRGANLDPSGERRADAIRSEERRVGKECRSRW